MEGRQEQEMREKEEKELKALAETKVLKVT